MRRFLSTLGVCNFSFSDLSFLCLPQRRRRLGEKKKKRKNKKKKKQKLSGVCSVELIMFSFVLTVNEG